MATLQKRVVTPKADLMATDYQSSAMTPTTPRNTDLMTTSSHSSKITPTSSRGTELTAMSSRSTALTPASTRGAIGEVVVIPQVAYSFRGAFKNPFARCYAPCLVDNDIDETTFLAFLDGVNECFIGNPVFTGLQIAGRVMAQFYSVHPVQFAGIGLDFAAGFVSAGVSYARTRAYFKATNADLFHPRGLHATVLKTSKMTAKVRYPHEKIQNLPVDWDNEPMDKDEGKETEPDGAAVARRMRALEGYVAPLSMDVPQAEAPDNLLKKMGAAQARRSDRKQQKKQSKKVGKANEEYEKKMRHVEREQRKVDKEVDKLERKMDKLTQKTEEKLDRTSDTKKQDKIEAEFEKEIRKIQKEIDKKTREGDKEISKKMKEAGKKRAKIEKKEGKHTNKVRWIVISKWDGDADASTEEDANDDDNDLEDDDDEEEEIGERRLDPPPAYTERA